MGAASAAVAATAAAAEQQCDGAGHVSVLAVAWGLMGRGVQPVPVDEHPCGA